MKLDFIEVCGFRGFREKVRVIFGSGFTVITGRNGVGKSTLFDAVEYALTGSIDKYTVEKAAQESLSDYLWWRGVGRADAHYVTVAFKGDAGEVFTVTRSRESGADKTPAEQELSPGRRAASALQNFNHSRRVDCSVERRSQRNGAL
jgi:chromosome segregation protein